MKKLLSVLVTSGLICLSSQVHALKATSAGDGPRAAVAAVIKHMDSAQKDKLQAYISANSAIAILYKQRLEAGNKIIALLGQASYADSIQEDLSSRFAVQNSIYKEKIKYWAFVYNLSTAEQKQALDSAIQRPANRQHTLSYQNLEDDDSVAIVLSQLNAQQSAQFKAYIKKVFSDVNVTTNDVFESRKNVSALFLKNHALNKETSKAIDVAIADQLKVGRQVADLVEYAFDNIATDKQKIAIRAILTKHVSKENQHLRQVTLPV